VVLLFFSISVGWVGEGGGAGPGGCSDIIDLTMPTNYRDEYTGRDIGKLIITVWE
jgi:hypothetical protein